MSALFERVRSREYLGNTKTVMKERPLFWPFCALVAIKIGQNSRIIEENVKGWLILSTIHGPWIVKPANNKPPDNEGRLNMLIYSGLFPNSLNNISNMN